MWDAILEKHSGELTILIIAVLVLVTLLIVTPQLLRMQREYQQMVHEERMRALEHGQILPAPDYRSVAAGRTAFLVPIVVICTAGTVTCFLVAYRLENLFAVALAVWSVVGVVGLAAITGGVALMGRLAQLHSSEDEDAGVPSNPLTR